MPVPSSISDLSTTPSLNSPAGTESPSTVDDYLRTQAAFIRQVDDKATGTVKAADLAAPGGSALVGFQQAGAGAVSRTVQAKLGEVVSVKDFGAVGDGVTDDTAAIQKALDYVNSIGGGEVVIPAGRFRKADTPGSTLKMYSNTTLRGLGDSSVIFWDDRDTVARSGNDMLICDNTVNVSFENFKIEGTALTYTNETNQKQCLTGSNIDGLRVVNVTIEKVRYMATAFSYAKNVYMAGNRLDYIVRDGLRVTNGENVVITGNTLRRVADDAIAVHSLDVATTPGSGVTITNNTLEACQGIKVLGAKVVSIRGNIIRRSLRNPVRIAIPGSGTEGNTPQFAIDVSGNTITDTFGNLGTNYIIQIVQSLARSAGGLGTFPGINSAPYAYNYLNNIDSGTPVVIGQFGIRVCDNIIARTLPDGVTYSSWGYGQLFDRLTTNFLSDPTITSSAFALHGLDIGAPASAMQVHGNNISGTGVGLAAIRMTITGSTNRQDFSSISIQSNTIFDCPGSGISCTTTGSGAGAKQVVVQNNTFDLDPFFRAAAHNADNTWSSTGMVVAINTLNTIGWLVGGNVFKNCGQAGTLLSTIGSESSPNIVYADFVGQGDNAGNKGVRQLPSAALNIIVPIDGDPTSSTFGQISNTVVSRAAAIPSAGRYVQGHRVWRDLPAIAGAAGSQYVIPGWVRLTTGSNHVLNTDWAEMRTLTGT